MKLNVIKAAILPLRFIFWGGLLCVLDFSFSSTVNGSGFKFDVLNDAVGAACIAWGTFKLAPAQVHDRYARVMTFVKIVAALAVLDAIREHFITPYIPPIVGFLVNVFGLVVLAATVAFCIAMRWFCENADLQQAAASWRFTTLLFVFIYVLPLGLFHIAGCIAILTDASFHFDLGPAGLLLLPLFLWPVVHLFISTSRMKRAAAAYVHPILNTPAPASFRPDQ
jgi:hypothetical protein